MPYKPVFGYMHFVAQPEGMVADRTSLMQSIGMQRRHRVAAFLQRSFVGRIHRNRDASVESLAQRPKKVLIRFFSHSLTACIRESR